MNRKKKRDAILKKRLKKAKAKLAPKSKSTYVSKADRAKLALEEQAQLEQGSSELVQSEQAHSEQESVEGLEAKG